MDNVKGNVLFALAIGLPMGMIYAICDGAIGPPLGAIVTLSGAWLMKRIGEHLWNSTDK